MTTSETKVDTKVEAPSGAQPAAQVPQEASLAKPGSTAVANPVTDMVPAAATSRALGPMMGTDSFRSMLEPTNYKELWAIAMHFAKMELCGVKLPEDAMVRILWGRELGWGAVQSMRSIYVVYGRPSLEALAMLALCKQSALCEEFVCTETTAEKATFRAKRRGEEAMTMSFTVAEAKLAQLVKKDSNWEKWPAQMCRARCISNLAQLIFPDVTRGIDVKEIAEEMIGEVVPNGGGTPAEMSLPRVAPQAQARDFDVEREAFLARVAGPLTKASAAELRRDIGEWDAPPPFKQPVLEAYEKRMKPVQGRQADAPAGQQSLVGEPPKPTP